MQEVVFVYVQCVDGDDDGTVRQETADDGLNAIRKKTILSSSLSVSLKKVQCDPYGMEMATEGESSSGSPAVLRYCIKSIKERATFETHIPIIITHTRTGYTMKPPIFITLTAKKIYDDIGIHTPAFF